MFFPFLVGDNKNFAVIKVTYPSGSILTCSKGSKKIKAQDTSGKAVLLIPEAGTWVIECHTSDDSKSRDTTVVITSKNQFESAHLEYSITIPISVSAGKTAEAGTYDAKATEDSTTTFSTVSYKTLKVTYKTGGYSTTGGASGYLRLCDSSNKVLVQSGNLAYHNDGAVWTADISNINVDNCHIQVYINVSGGSNGYTIVFLSASQVYLV